MSKSKSVLSLVRGLLPFSLVALTIQAQNEIPRSGYNPNVAPASDEGEMAIKKFAVPAGLKVDLWAAEPHLANVVGFGFDEKGRAYVCETFRHFAGVSDIRGLRDWLDEDLASRSVNDRLDMMKRHLGERIADFKKESERVKLLEDRDGDGKVEPSTVFADGFNTILDGIGASVLARKGDVYFTDIPNLWLLRDTNGDGAADFRKSLHYGFGLRIGFLGHDLHGLRFGPDGKLYFSVGDRGSNIKVREGRMVGEPDTGCVFRCNPDGSELEVFAFGLRNPQALAFDDYGNLFTGDNNSDSGDRARWVYLVEGGDSGWRIGYQFLERPYSRGPFNAEKLWYPQFDGQAAYIVPPITNITDGPSGLSYYPGTGLPEKYRGHFFLVDFRGSSANSGVHSFALKPHGASFDLVNHMYFVSRMLATDCQFGVEGGLYVSDWVQGWNKTGKGRIYRIHEPALDRNTLVRETKKLMAEGMDKRSLKELAILLAHPDQRVRQEAQFALADKGTAALKTLVNVAAKNQNQLARLHAIWAINQISSKFKPADSQPETAAALDSVLALIADHDAEVRAQAVKVLGEQNVQKSFDGLGQLLADASPRVRFFAAMSLGKLGRREAMPAIFAFLRENADRDPYLRHAGVMALAWINDVDSLVTASRNTSRSVRLGAVLALRRLERPEIAAFLNDSDEAVVLEAARAINDLPINGAMPELAALVTRSTRSEPLLRRVLNANFRHGVRQTAEALAAFAAKTEAPETMRAEALNELADWPKPSGRDRVTGMWRPTSFVRDVNTPANALEPAIVNVLRTAPDDVRLAAARAAGRLAITEAGPALRELAGDTNRADGARIEALRTLVDLNDAHAAEAVRLALSDNDPPVRREATRLQPRVKAVDTTRQLATTLEKGTISDKQAALGVLGGLADPAADGILAQWLDSLQAGNVPKELQFDVLEAAAKRSSTAIKQKLAAYEASKPQDDPMAKYRELLWGGNAAEGRKIFFERPEASCMRCHKINGEGGEVGPDFSKLGAQKDRQYILESILFPNKQIAPGFDSVMVALKDGTLYAGVLKQENDSELVINSPEDGLVTVKKADIKSRNKGLSGMPEGMDGILTRQDLRNLVEFLAEQK